MKGDEVLTVTNAARGALGLGLLPGLVLSSCEHDNRVGLPGVRDRGGDGVCTRSQPGGRVATSFGTTTANEAGRVAEAVGVELEESGGIAVPEAMDSLLTADGFGLTFLDHDGCLKGWIEPTDDDQTRWDLHLMPGHAYPPGSEADANVVRETVFDSARYLDGLLLSFDPPEDESRRRSRCFSPAARCRARRRCSNRSPPRATS